MEERVALWTGVVRKAPQNVIVELPDSEESSGKAKGHHRPPQLPQSVDEFVIETDSEVNRDQGSESPANTGSTTTLVVWNGDQSTSESSDTQLSEDEARRSAAYRTHADYLDNSLSTEASEIPLGLNSAWRSVSESESESEAENIVSLTSSSGSQSAALRSLEHAFGLPESEDLSDTEPSESGQSDSEVSASEPDSGSESDVSRWDPEVLCSQPTTVSSTPSSSETGTQEFEDSDLDEAKSNELAFRYLNAVSDPWESSVSNAASDEEPEEEDARGARLDWPKGSRWTDSIAALEPVKTPKHFRFHNETGLLMELSQEGRHKRFWHDEFSEVKDEQEFAQLFGLCTQRQRAKRSRKS